MPKSGAKLDIEDIGIILDAVNTRRANFPEEPEDITWTLVLLNIGQRWASVTCTEGEWVGQKKDVELPPEGDIPKCPNGHPLFQGPGLCLAWTAAE